MSDDTLTFDYDTFIRLEPIALSGYVEPFLYNREAVVPRAALERIAAELPIYDEGHLVFGMDLGVTHRPDLFAERLPAYLNHAEMSVRGAACRGLRRLAAEHITDRLIDEVKAILASSPEARRIAVGVPGVMPELLDKLDAERRLRSGLFA